MSTICEELHEHRGESSAEQKLKVLRTGLVRPVLTVRSAVSLLTQIDSEVAQCLPESVSPDEFANVVRWLSQAASDLTDILDALAADSPETEPHPTH